MKREREREERERETVICFTRAVVWECYGVWRATMGGNGDAFNSPQGSHRLEFWIAGTAAVTDRFSLLPLYERRKRHPPIDLY